MRRRTEPLVEELPEQLPAEGPLLAGVRHLGRGLLRQPRRWAWIAPLAWAGLVWLLSSQELGFAGAQGRGLALLANLAHAFEFGVLALLCLPLAPREEGWVRLDGEVLGWVAGLTLGWAAADEVHQAFVAGRHASPFDLLTDAVGVFCTLKIAIYVSTPEATGRGLAGRLLYGVALCALAAGFATLGGGPA